MRSIVQLKSFNARGIPKISALKSTSLRRFSSKVSTNLDPFSLAKHLSGHHFYNGEFQKPISGKTFDVHNPATGEVIGKAAKGDAKDIDAVVSIADKAQKQWGSVPVRQRGELVYQCGNLLKAHVEELAKLTSLETGKAIRTESRIEAGVVSDVFNFYGGLAPEIKGETIPFNQTSMTFTQRYPVGVIGAIIPWNAPLLLMALKVAPAVLAGNSIIVKSAEEAPFGVLRIAELLNTILPKGVLNIVSGYGPECGGPLVSHPKVKKVTFTGSVETGKTIYKIAAEKLAPVTLELGGKSPMIVMGDADLEKAVDGAITSMRFTRQGQSCTAASRIFVHESIHDKFVEKLQNKVNLLKMGNPLSDETDMGTVISQNQLDKIKGYIESGTKEPGVKAIACGQMPSDPALKKGLFIRPVLFTGISNKSKVAQEEIFGPVCCIIKWSDFDKVIEEANDTEFGLSASVWTNNYKQALNAVNKLEAGIVQVNQNLVIQSNLPVGGWKSSGLGREGSLETMLEHFTKRKTIALNLQ